MDQVIEETCPPKNIEGLKVNKFIIEARERFIIMQKTL